MNPEPERALRAKNLRLALVFGAVVLALFVASFFVLPK